MERTIYWLTHNGINGTEHVYVESLFDRDPGLVDPSPTAPVAPPPPPLLSASSSSSSFHPRKEEPRVEREGLHHVDAVLFGEDLVWRRDDGSTPKTEWGGVFPDSPVVSDFFHEPTLQFVLPFLTRMWLVSRPVSITAEVVEERAVRDPEEEPEFEIEMEGDEDYMLVIHIHVGCSRKPDPIFLPSPVVVLFRSVF